MGSLLEKIDGKQIAILVTSVGGIILAGFLAYSLLKISTNDIQHLEAAVGGHATETRDIQKETNQVLREVTKTLEQNAGALQQNTKAVEQLNQNLFLKR